MGNPYITGAILVIIFIIVYFAFFRGNTNALQGEKPSKYTTVDDRYNEARKKREDELNELLAKVNKRGINSLSKSERKRLDELSRK